MDNKILINTKMMGGFQCSANGKAVEFAGATNTKLSQLFIYLMYSFPQALPLSNVQKMLYEDSDVDMTNSFKAILFRLRNVLSEELGIPQNECVILRGGMIKLSDRFEITSDVSALLNEFNVALAAENESDKIAHLERFVSIYHGEILPMFSASQWVIFENAVIGDKYTRAVNRLGAYYSENKRFDDAYGLYKRALVYFPFDEDWIVASIDSLIALGRFKQAMVEYEEAADAIYDELGVYPSERLLDAMRRISTEFSGRENLNDVENEILSDDDGIGAYYCNFPSFVSCCHILQRVMKRDSVISSMAIITLTDKSGKVLKDMSDIIPSISNMRIAISKTLRKNDMYTRYSKAQLVVFLWNSPSENVPVVMTRLKKHYSELFPESEKMSFSYEVIDSGALPAAPGIAVTAEI